MTMHNWRGLVAAIAFSALSAAAIGVQASTAVDPEAVSILRHMSEYLSSLKKFSFRTDNTVDLVTRSGQQLQTAAQVEVSIHRPNRFRVNRRGDIAEQEFYFDGTTLTLYGKVVDYYAQMRLSQTVDIDTALDIAREEIGVIAPTSDLFYQNAYEGLMADVEEGMVVGAANIGGVDVHHLAFRGSEVDWQIWIDKGNEPLPRKYVITSKWVTGAPQFSASFTDWNTSAQLEDAMFQFSPPAGAVEIGFIPLRGAGGAGTGER
jgi:hypothetical protein